MNNQKSLIYTSAILAILGLSNSTIHAAATASDTAANYTSSWGTSPPNGGAGFGPWSITLNNANNPPYVGTYLDQTSYNSYGDSVLSSGYAWGTYANQGNNNGSFVASRPFTAGASGSSSLYDQTFSVDLSSGGVGDGNGGPPNSLLQVSLGNAFTFGYSGTAQGDACFFSVDGGAAQATSVNFGDLGSGLQISLAVSGALNSPSEDYTLTVGSVNGNSTYFTQSGTFNSAAYNTSSFVYDDANTTGNGYFNNLNITAENPPAATPDSSNLILELGMLAAGFAIALRKKIVA